MKKHPVDRRLTLEAGVVMAEVAATCWSRAQIEAIYTDDYVLDLLTKAKGKQTRKRGMLWDRGPTF